MSLLLHIQKTGFSPVFIGCIINSVGENFTTLFLFHKKGHKIWYNVIDKKTLKGIKLMSNNDYILKLLNIEDKNIYIDQNRELYFEIPVLLKKLQ